MKRLVYRAQLARAEASGRWAQALGVDHRRLLDEDARLLVAKGDQGPGSSQVPRWSTWARRCSCSGAELVGLKNDGVSRPALFSTTRSARRR